MRFQIKYVTVGVIGLISAILLFVGIKSVYYPPCVERVEISSPSYRLEAAPPSVKTDARSTPELAVPQQEIEEAIAFLEDLENKESDESVESQSTPLQPMGIRQRMKAFQKSSKEYQELNEQRRPLILHSALLISDLGIYFSNPRGTYIEQAIPGEPEKKQVENGALIYSSESPLFCADAFVTRVCPKNTRTC